jgi:hypothetical protein
VLESGEMRYLEGDLHNHDLNSVFQSLMNMCIETQ